MAPNLLQNKQTTTPAQGEAEITPRCFARAEEASTEVRHHLSAQQKQLFANPLKRLQGLIPCNAKTLLFPSSTTTRGFYIEQLTCIISSVVQPCTSANMLLLSTFNVYYLSSAR